MLIFQKQPDFSADRVRQLLSAVPLDDVRQITLLQAGKSTQLMMPESLRAANAAGGTWSDLFSLDGPANRLYYLATSPNAIARTRQPWLAPKTA